jgi:hypothetical protein
MNRPGANCRAIGELAIDHCELGQEAALAAWQKGIESGLAQFHDVEKEEDGNEFKWHLQFVGYVTQQYTAKSVRGERQPVKAYDRIIKIIPQLIESQLVARFTSNNGISLKVGKIPNLHSLVPLSQSANVPIFELKAQHGVVGAHFVKVSECEDIIGSVADKLQRFIKLSFKKAQEQVLNG